MLGFHGTHARLAFFTPQAQWSREQPLHVVLCFLLRSRSLWRGTIGRSAAEPPRRSHQTSGPRRGGGSSATLARRRDARARSHWRAAATRARAATGAPPRRAAAQPPVRRALRRGRRVAPRARCAAPCRRGGVRSQKSEWRSAFNWQNPRCPRSGPNGGGRSVHLCEALAQSTFATCQGT